MRSWSVVYYFTLAQVVISNIWRLSPLLVLSLIQTLQPLDAGAGVIFSAGEIVGDNDGFGLGVPDGARGVVWPGSGLAGSGYDGRDAYEMSDDYYGSQLTDSYAALRPGFGPHSSYFGVVRFQLGQVTLLSGEFTVDMGDFEASQFGELFVFFNDVYQPGLFDFDDGFGNTAVRTFALDSATIERINEEDELSKEFRVSISTGSTADFVAFDYFQFFYTAEDNSRMPAVPEPTSIAIFGLGGLAVICMGVRKKQNIRNAVLAT